MANVAVTIPDIRGVKARLGMPPAKRGPTLVAFTEDQLREMVEEAVGELGLGLVEKKVRGLVRQYCGLRLRSEIESAIDHRLKVELKKLAEIVAERAAIESATSPLIPSWKKIVDEVAIKYEVSVVDLISERRNAPLPQARFEAMYRMKTETPMSLPAIGQRLGGRDHTTVLNGIKQHKKRIEAEQP